MVPQANSRRLAEAVNTGGLDGRAKQAIAALVGMLLVGVVGAILDWPWWLEYALIAPWGAWLIVSGRLVLYRQLRPGSSDQRVPALLVVPILLAGATRPTRYSGLVVVVAFVVVYIFSRRAEHAASLSKKTARRP
jgi:hypothetical protein